MSITGEESTYVSAALESGSKKAGEHAADIILNKSPGFTPILTRKNRYSIRNGF